MGNRRIILELDREPQDLQAVWRLDSIARLIQQALTIRNGWVILEGEVEWWYQKNAAEVAVRHLSGVRGVSNSISIKSTDKIPAVGMDIEAAFARNALLDAKQIRIEIDGSKVMLHGKVRTLAEREEAERVAWAAQGVLSVEDHLDVKWSSFAE